MKSFNAHIALAMVELGCTLDMVEKIYYSASMAYRKEKNESLPPIRAMNQGLRDAAADSPHDPRAMSRPTDGPRKGKADAK